MFVFSKDLKTLKEDKGKWTCKDSFKVQKIDYVDDKIVYVKIINLKSNKEIEFGTPGQAQKEINEVEKLVIDEVKVKALEDRCKKDNVDINTIYKLYKVNELSELTEKQYANINQFWDKLKEA